MINAYKYVPDDPILIQNEKPRSLRVIPEVSKTFCCKFIVNIIAQTPQDNKTKNKIIFK